jgi:hypothetical protein
MRSESVITLSANVLWNANHYKMPGAGIFGLRRRRFGFTVRSKRMVNSFAIGFEQRSQSVVVPLSLPTSFFGRDGMPGSSENARRRDAPSLLNGERETRLAAPVSEVTPVWFLGQKNETSFR